MKWRGWEVVDLVVALVLAATGVLPYLDRPAVAVCQLALCGVVAVRRRICFWGAVTVAVLFVVEALVSPTGQAPEDQVSLVAVPLLAYTVAAYRPRPVAVAGLLVLLAGVMAETRLNGGGGDYLFGVGFVLVGWLPGAILYGRRLELRALVDDRRRRDELAAAAERARLARELHDIVAHSVGVMTVQAAAAEQVLDSAPDAARRALGDVQRVGHDTVVELHRLLGLLRADEDKTSPRPRLSELPELLRGRAGELEVRGEARPLPAALELSAYRIVQEAVTNATRYAPGSPVRIRVEYTSDSLVLVVDDDGPRRRTPGAGPVTPLEQGGGHGLVGMRERVGLFGGGLTAGPRTDGGFRVSVRLPVSA